MSLGLVVLEKKLFTRTRTPTPQSDDIKKYIGAFYGSRADLEGQATMSSVCRQWKTHICIKMVNHKEIQLSIDEEKEENVENSLMKHLWWPSCFLK